MANMNFAFGTFVLDLNRGELRGENGPVQVEPRAFSLLTHFLRNPGRLISKDELIETVWDGQIVSDAAISTAIKAARQLLEISVPSQIGSKPFAGAGFGWMVKLRIRSNQM